MYVLTVSGRSTANNFYWRKTQIVSHEIQELLAVRGRGGSAMSMAAVVYSTVNSYHLFAGTPAHPGKVSAKKK